MCTLIEFKGCRVEITFITIFIPSPNIIVKYTKGIKDSQLKTLKELCCTVINGRKIKVKLPT